MTAPGVDRTIHLVGNAHLDPVWLWRWPEGFQEARATFWSAIHRLDEYADFVFTCDQVVLLSWVEQQDPALFARIIEHVAGGRWVNAGGWWVEPDCNLPLGESFARQGLYGQRFLISRFGKPATVGMNVDPFGHSAMIPAILRGHGIDSYVFLRPGPHENPFAQSLFHWQSPDGSRVLAYRIPFEYGSGSGPVDGQIEKALGQLDRSQSDLMIFYGVGNHGGGPTRANIDSIHRFDAMGTFGTLRMSSPREYFDRQLASGDSDGFPVRSGDLQHHAVGCYSAHSGIKAWQRRAQYAVLEAERWAAIVALTDGIPYPRNELELAWKQILFNQFHDILPGSAIEPAYEDARDQLGEAVAISTRITTLAHGRIARRVAIAAQADSQPLLIFNQHPWPVESEVTVQYGGVPGAIHVLDEQGRAVAFQQTRSAATTDDRGRGAIVFRAAVPALGYRLYRYAAGPAAPPARTRPLVTTEAVLENDFVRIGVHPSSGSICSLLDKATGIDLLAGAAHELHTQISADPSDTWGHRVVSYAGPGSRMSLTRIAVKEAGPLRSRLRIEYAWQSSTVIEELILAHDSSVLRVEVTIDWRERAHLLKLRFATAIQEATATFEIPFGHLERPIDGAEQPGQGWVDVTGHVHGRPAGLTLITTDKQAFDVSPQPAGVSIGITAVRSPVFAWHDPRPLEADGDYSYQDQGVQHFSYELVPHAGDWRATQPTRRAALLASPLRAMLEASHPGTLPSALSFASDGNSAVMITAIKGTEDAGGDGQLIVRAVETSGTAQRARIDLPVVDRTLDLEFGPHQIRTFRVPLDAQAPVTEVDLVERPCDPPQRPRSHGP